GGVVEAQCTKGLGNARRARITIRILLGEDRNLFRLQPAQLDQIVHDRGGFLRIARAIVEYITIGGIGAQDIGTCESAEEQGPPLQREGYSDGGGRRSDIADNAEYRLRVAE